MADSERPNAPVSASLEAATEADRRPGAYTPIRVAVVGATGYVGAELVRLLDRHPAVTIVGLVGRGRDDEPIGSIHPHLANTPHLVDADLRTRRVFFTAGSIGDADRTDQFLAGKDRQPALDRGDFVQQHEPGKPGLSPLGHFARR